MRAKLPFAVALTLLASAGCTSAITTGAGQATTAPPGIATPTQVQVPTPSPPALPQTPAVSSPAASTSAVAPSTSVLGPAAVVEAFYAAINSGDYYAAWLLGGDNLGESYAAFAAGFSDTLSDQLTITGTSGHSVDVDLVAQHTDGTRHEFHPGDAFVIPKGWVGIWDMKTPFKTIIVNS